MKEGKFFSIIVPIYGVEKYLKDCIDSILSQSYKNYEIILVDDESPDNCPQICDEYSNQYDFIKTIHKKNGGLSDARNKGVAASQGKYIIFLDSDDYWDDNNLLNKIHEIIIERKCEICLFGTKKLFEDSGEIVSPERLKINHENCLEELIKYNYIKACACDKVIKSDILIKNNIIFPLGRYSEDIKWTFDVLCECENISYLNENSYVYRQRKGSITKTVGEKNIQDMNDLIDYGIEKTKSMDVDKKKKLKSFLAYEYSVVLGLISSKKCSNIDTNLIQKIYDKKTLLKYNISRKVKMVYILERILGIKNTSKILGKFIDMKKG